MLIHIRIKFKPFLNKYSFFLFLLIFPFNLFAFDSFYNQKDFIFTDTVYDPHIQTVLFHREGMVSTLPVIRLNSNEQLRLRFDDLSGDYRQFQYTIIHCDVNWQPTFNLFKSEYIEGLFEDYISMQMTSRNTYVSYVHYNLVFPTISMKPKISGNFVLLVYKNNDINNLVLSRRFYIVEHLAGIEGQAKPSRYVRERDKKQTVEFVVSYPDHLSIINPSQELIVNIRQNGRLDNKVKNAKADVINGNQLIYSEENDNVFLAGNEYRQFDVRSLRNPRLNVNSLILQDTIFQAVLYPDINRAGLTYSTYTDFNGYRTIFNRDGHDHHSESDYVWVWFSLERSSQLRDAEIYVFGALSNWQLDERFKMRYNNTSGNYEAGIFLKQGYYNYKYVAATDLSTPYNTTYFEGTHYQTENNYYVFVYLKRALDQSYRLIGFKTFNTVTK